MHSTEIPPWLRKILDESPDPDACMKAIRRVVMPVWRPAHPRPLPWLPRPRPGPRRLELIKVWVAVENVLGGLTPAGRKTITWKWFLFKVQQTVGNSPNRKWGKSGPGLYDETVLRPLMWNYILKNVAWGKIPPKLLARRQRWMPTDRLMLDALHQAGNTEPERFISDMLRELRTRAYYFPS